MGIIGTLKGLIFGAMPEPKFSERDVLVAKQRAETLVRELNESLKVAGHSKSKRIREEKLQIVRERLVELKKLAIKFPFLHLENLQAVESSIIKVEDETSSLPHSKVVDTRIKDSSGKAQPESLAMQRKEIESSEMGDQGRQHFSANDKQAILLCIQGCFRVINESIAIARKSKNLETKFSRLGVARDKLKEARKQAGQFSLDVGGFDEAEAEINRIEEAIKNGASTEIAGMQQIDVNTEFSSAARSLLKEATSLKKEKKYIEACDKLREAYSADGAEYLMIEDRLRLPMYLQLAGKNDEGWNELNLLNLRYVDQFSQPAIANQMRVFLQKGGKAKEAVLYGIWTLCKVIEANNMNLESCYRLADSMKASIYDTEPVVGQTPSGNPVRDSSYQHFADTAKNQFSIGNIETHVAPLLKKAKLDGLLNSLSTSLKAYLESNEVYDIEEIQNIFAKHLVEIH